MRQILDDFDGLPLPRLPVMPGVERHTREKAQEQPAVQARVEGIGDLLGCQLRDAIQGTYSGIN